MKTKEISAAQISQTQKWKILKTKHEIELKNTTEQMKRQ